MNIKANRASGARTVEGSMRPNDLGFEQVERFRVNGNRTTEG